MNKVYRIVWSEARQDWIVAQESAKGHGKSSASKTKTLSMLMSGLLAITAQADPIASGTLPTGGQVTGGQATISQSGNVLNIQQTTGKASINWNTFSIGSGAQVNFVQPNSASVTLNRVVGADPSYIYGQLTANGQVFLMNPNGVLFGAGSRVDVGGLVASTLNLKDADFFSGNYRFTGSGQGSVVNQGELLGKYVALLAPEVRNEGIIVARQGTVAMAGSTGVTLNLVNNQLIDVLVDKADINTLVENRHLIQAQEGTVILSAQSASNLLGKVVNSGSIEAKGIVSDGGIVRLVASTEIDHSGSINVDAGTNGKGGSAIIIADLSNTASRTSISGSISARGGSSSGDGGFIETSASHLKVADSARINTTAAFGKMGTWLLDPFDFIIGTDITGAALSTALDSASVVIDTNGGTCTGVTCPAGGSNGDIIFNEAVYWTNGTTDLTLNAYRNIVFNKSVIRDNPSSMAPAIQMTYGLGGTGTAYTTSTADWVTPFVNDGFPVPGSSMFIQDNTYGSPILTPAVILGAHTGSPLDLYLGAKNIPIYVNAVSGSSTYDGNSVPFLPAFSLDAPGATQIDIIPTLTAGAPAFNTAAPKHAGTYSGVLYTGGLTSDAYAGLTAGNAGATWTINQATLTVSLANSVGQKTKTYDGTNAAPGSFTPTYSFSGLVSGDTAAILSNTGATYNSVHAGARTLTVAGLAITGITGSNGSVAGDYVLAATTAGAAGTISPIQLTATLTNSGTTKVYDGTNAAPGGFTPTYSFTGSFLAGDTAATLSNTTALFNGSHVVGTNGITVSGLAITGITGGNGSLAGDYALTASTASASATITPVMLTATLTNVGTTKVYDGTTAAPSGFIPTYSITGTPVGTDTPTFSGTFTYNSKNVIGATSIGATNLQVSGVTGSSDGSLATDYGLTSHTVSASATITKATLSSTAVGAKIDDGKDSISGSQIKANGVTVSGITEYFAFTGTGLLPDTLVDVKNNSTGSLADVGTLALNTATGYNGAIASNYNAPPAYAAPTDFSISVSSVAKDLTPVDIIKRTIAAQLEKSQRGTDTTITDFWKKVNQTAGVTQEERDTVIQSVLNSVKKLCGPNCAVDEATVASVLGGLTGCSAGFVLSGGQCTPEQKQAQTAEKPVEKPADKPAVSKVVNPLTDTDTDAQKIIKLARALRITKSDEELASWVAQQQSKGVPFENMKNSLGENSDEMIALYGTDTLAFVNNIYLNVFNRNADFSGLLYWAGEIDAGRLTKAGAAYGILQGLKSSEETPAVSPPPATPAPTATPAAPAATVSTISETNARIKSMVVYFKDVGEDNTKMANYVNIANNVGGAGKTPVTDDDVKWVTDYVNAQGKNKSPAVTVTTEEVSAWLNGGKPATPQASVVTPVTSLNTAPIPGATGTVGAKKEFIAPSDLSVSLTTAPIINLGKKSAGAAAASALKNDVSNNMPPAIPDGSPTGGPDGGTSGSGTPQQKTSVTPQTQSVKMADQRFPQGSNVYFGPKGDASILKKNFTDFATEMKGMYEKVTLPSYDLKFFNDEISKAKSKNATDEEINNYKEKMFDRSFRSSCETLASCKTQEFVDSQRARLGMPPMSDAQRAKFPTLQQAYDKFKPADSATSGTSTSPSEQGTSTNSSPNPPPTQKSVTTPDQTTTQLQSTPATSPVPADANSNTPVNPGASKPATGGQQSGDVSVQPSAGNSADPSATVSVPSGGTSGTGTSLTGMNVRTKFPTLTVDPDTPVTPVTTSTSSTSANTNSNRNTPFDVPLKGASRATTSTPTVGQDSTTSQSPSQPQQSTGTQPESTTPKSDSPPATSAVPQPQGASSSQSSQGAATKTLTPDVSGSAQQSMTSTVDAALGTVESHLIGISTDSGSSSE